MRTLSSSLRYANNKALTSFPMNNLRSSWFRPWIMSHHVWLCCVWFCIIDKCGLHSWEFICQPCTSWVLTRLWCHMAPSGAPVCWCATTLFTVLHRAPSCQHLFPWYNSGLEEGSHSLWEASFVWVRLNTSLRADAKMDLMRFLLFKSIHL